MITAVNLKILLLVHQDLARARDTRSSTKVHEKCWQQAGGRLARVSVARIFSSIFSANSAEFSERIDSSLPAFVGRVSRGILLLVVVACCNNQIISRKFTWISKVYNGQKRIYINFIISDRAE